MKEGELEVREVELVGVKGELEVEKMVAGVYEMGEERLDGVAGKLKGVAKESLGDLDGVFGKLGTSLFMSCFFMIVGRDRCLNICSPSSRLPNSLDCFQVEKRRSRTPTLRLSAPSRLPLSARPPNSSRPFKSTNKLRASSPPT